MWSCLCFEEAACSRCDYSTRVAVLPYEAVTLMVVLETCGIRHAGLLPRASNAPADHNRGFAKAGRLSRLLSGFTRGWKRSASEMTSGRDQGWQGELGAACEQVPRQSIYGMFHPRLGDGLPCVGGRRCLRHTWDEAPGCDVWIEAVSAVIGLLLGGGVAQSLVRVWI